MDNDPKNSTAGSPTSTPASSTAAPASTQKPSTTAPVEQREYFFPQHGKTIAAPSREEAEAKLAALLTSEK